MAHPRMTLATQAVLRALLWRPAEDQYGLEIATRAGLPGGTIYPILARLEQIGWLESRWENLDPHIEGRPLRRYYSLNKGGVVAARDALAEVERRKKTRSATSLPTAEGLT